MKLILPLLAATAVGAVMTLAAAASVGPYAASAFSNGTGITAANEDRGAIILTSDDDDDSHEYRKERRAGDDDEDSEDSEDDDDDNGAGMTPNPAPAGTVAPPANGLFGNGPAPRAKVN
jgi:hypothetical protein